MLNVSIKMKCSNLRVGNYTPIDNRLDFDKDGEGSTAVEMVYLYVN